MKRCKCEHWQTCPTCYPQGFDEHGARKPVEIPSSREELQREITELREQVEKLTKERDAEIARNRPLQSMIKSTEETKSFLLKKSEENKEAVKQLDSERQANALLTEELAALAEQNAKMRKALTKWRYLDGSYNWRCGHCGNEVEEGHKEGCALSLPNLATPVLNRLKAEAYREAADIVENIDVYTFVHGGSSYDDGGITLSSAATAIRAKAAEYLISALDTIADELEKTNG